MKDVIDIIKNLQVISENTGAFNVVKDFERVIDELDVYVFENWEDGELVEGPYVNRHDVTCKFMWPLKLAPDPNGARRLSDYGCKVVYKKDSILLPRKIKDPGDFRPGTRKGKIDEHPVWIVTITMPKKLMQDVLVGQENKESARMAELMKYNKADVTQEAAAQQAPEEAPANA
ncbi:MAG: hypothetical protein EBU90_20125 [Proteobacteria bacterium]|nr:hypothetical protein [Pseudomonadota bacterium]NBP14632.1 hypothetical protein [bacterium]